MMASSGPATSSIRNDTAPSSRRLRSIRGNGARPAARRRRRGTGKLIFLAPAAIFLAAVTFYPLVILVRMSVSRVKLENFLVEWPFVGLENFGTLLSSDEFLHSAAITAWFVAVILAATMILGLLIALVLKVENRLTRFTQAMMVMVWMTPPVVVGSLWKFLAASDGPLNGVLVGLGVLGEPIPVFAEPHLSLWGVAAVGLWVSLPFAGLIIKAALLDVPQDVMEAARVDGAGALRTLWHVVLPTIRPVLLIVGVLTIVYAFKNFEYIYVMTQGGPGAASTILPYLGYQYAFSSYELDLGAAVALICVAFTTILAIFYARSIRREETVQ